MYKKSASQTLTTRHTKLTQFLKNTFLNFENFTEHNIRFEKTYICRNKN